MPSVYSLAEQVLKGTQLHIEMTSVSCIEKYFIEGSTSKWMVKTDILKSENKIYIKKY